MGLNLTGIMAVITLAISLAFGTYFTVSQKRIASLIENQAKLELAVKTQEQTIATLNARYKNQLSALTALTADNKNLTTDRDRLVNKLIDHDLEELSRYKPALVEKRINDGTKQVFDSFVNLSTK
jgi:amino acid permease